RVFGACCRFATTSIAPAEGHSMKHRIGKGTVVGTLSALAAAVGAQPAFAQQETGASGLEEIVVTARFREENLQETPIAITAITAQEIEVRSFTNAAQVGYTVPNTYFQKAQAAFGNSMVAYIRGVGQYDFNFAFEPGVSMY